MEGRIAVCLIAVGGYHICQDVFLQCKNMYFHSLRQKHKTVSKVNASTKHKCKNEVIPVITDKKLLVQTPYFENPPNNF